MSADLEDLVQTCRRWAEGDPLERLGVEFHRYQALAWYLAVSRVVSADEAEQRVSKAHDEGLLDGAWWLGRRVTPLLAQLADEMQLLDAACRSISTCVGWAEGGTPDEEDLPLTLKHLNEDLVGLLSSLLGLLKELDTAMETNDLEASG